MTTVPDDWALLAAWVDGDAAAAELLIDGHQPRIYRFVRNKVRDPQTCADLCQQTFVGMLEAAPRARTDSAFSTWLLAIAKNVVYAHYRRHTKRGREQQDFTTVCINELEATTMSSIVTRRRQTQAVLDGLRDVSVEDQVLLELRYFEGMVAREVAAVLELAPGSMHRRTEAAIARLRQQVARRLADRPGHLPEVTVEQLDAWVEEVRALAYGKG